MFNGKISNYEINKIIDELDNQVYANRDTIKNELIYFSNLLSKRELKDNTPEEIIRLLFNDVTNEIEKFVDKYSFVPGMSIYSKINGIETEYSSGYTDYTMKKEIDSKTLFDVASISKTTTAILMYKCIEEKIININWKIKDILNELTNLPDELTIKDLLQYKGKYITEKRIDEACDKSEALKIIKSVMIDGNLLNEYNYNDLVPIICGIILERLEKRDIESIARTKILNPLKLNNIQFSGKLETKNITGTSNIDKGLCNDPKTNILSGYSGSAGIFSSTKDMALVMENLIKGNIFQSSLIDFYTANPLKLSRGIAGQSIVPTKIEKQGYFCNLSPIISLGEDGSTRTIATSGKYVLNKNNYYVSSAIFANPCSSNPDIIKYYEKKDNMKPGTYYRYYENSDTYRVDVRKIIPSGALDNVIFSLQKFNLRVSLLCAHIKLIEKNYNVEHVLKLKKIRGDVNENII